jgi:hypothetical protein
VRRGRGERADSIQAAAAGAASRGFHRRTQRNSPARANGAEGGERERRRGSRTAVDDDRPSESPSRSRASSPSG